VGGGEDGWNDFLVVLNVRSQRSPSGPSSAVTRTQ
jgi:hypothetical protein